MATVGAVAVVSLDGDRQPGPARRRRRASTNPSGCATWGRVFGLLAVRPRPPPTRTSKPSRPPPASGARHQPEVVGVDVDAVVALDGDRCLELAREVARARRAGSGASGSVEAARFPSSQISTYARVVGVRPLTSRGSSSCTSARRRSSNGAGAEHDVAFLVAAATERGEQRVVDGADRAVQVALEHAVELEVLPGGDAQRPVAPRARDAVVGEVCVGADHAAGDARADHHHVVLVEAEPARVACAGRGRPAGRRRGTSGCGRRRR